MLEREPAFDAHAGAAGPKATPPTNRANA